MGYNILAMKITELNDLIERNRTVQGRWSLNDGHEVVYREKDPRRQVRFKASILDVKPASLILRHTFREEDRKMVSRIHELIGKWRLDNKNRITFLIQRKNGKNDVLTFRNAWNVNKNHEIEYAYRETALKTKTKKWQRLVFKGFWDVPGKNRLVYWISQDSDSYFRFRGAFQTRSLRAKKGEIRYQAAITLEDKVRTQNIILSGKWKYSRAYGLFFEIKYSNGRKHAVEFGGYYHLSKNDRIEIRLKTPAGKPLGLELILTKDFLKGQGKAFTRLLHDADESRLEAGVSMAW